MKKTVLALVTLMAATGSFAQFNFKTAGEESSVIWHKENSGLNIGYAFSESEARFAYSIAQSTMNAATGCNTASGHNFKLMLPLTDGAGAVFSGGAFNPGLGAAWEGFYSRNDMAKNPVFWFLRISYNMQQNSFGSINSANNIQIDKKVNHALSVTPGFNWVLSTQKEKQNLIIGFSAAVRYNFNPVDDLETGEFVFINAMANNGHIQETKDAYIGTQEDFLSVTPKMDLAWTPVILTKEEEITNDENEEKETIRVETLRLGMISSLSARYNSVTGNVSWSYSIGPSMHPRWFTSNVIAALQAQFTDFNNSTGSKSFNDIFSVGFYVGIPLQFK